MSSISSNAKYPQTLNKRFGCYCFSVCYRVKLKLEDVILPSGWAIFSWLRWLINVFMQFHSQSKYLIVIGNVLFRFFQVGVIALTGEICDFYRTQRESALCSWLGWDNRTRNKKNRSVVYSFKKKNSFVNHWTIIRCGGHAWKPHWTLSSCGEVKLRNRSKFFITYSSTGLGPQQRCCL